MNTAEYLRWIDRQVTLVSRGFGLLDARLFYRVGTATYSEVPISYFFMDQGLSGDPISKMYSIHVDRDWWNYYRISLSNQSGSFALQRFEESVVKPISVKDIIVNDRDTYVVMTLCSEPEQGTQDVIGLSNAELTFRNPGNIVLNPATGNYEESGTVFPVKAFLWTDFPSLPPLPGADELSSNYQGFCVDPKTLDRAITAENEISVPSVIDGVSGLLKVTFPLSSPYGIEKSKGTELKGVFRTVKNV